MYTTYIHASNNTPFYTHISSYVVWREHPLGLAVDELEMKHLTKELILWKTYNH